MSKFYVGTAGWSYKDWEGVVYPTQKGRDFHALYFLGQYINIVEINSTFYRLPLMRISLSWVKKAEGFPDFLFAVKLHQVFTHNRKDFTQKEVDEFKMGIEPLIAAGRMAAILLQFPWSFANTISNMMFSLFQFSVAERLMICGSLVVALQAVGAAAGNMIAIHNVVAASATVGLLGKEGATLRKTILPTIYYILSIGIIGILAIYVLGTSDPF